MMSAFETMSVFYECQRCTACCRWPGQVRLTDNEIGQLATHLGLFGDEFIQQYLRLTRDRRSLALMEKGNGECVFLRDRERYASWAMFFAALEEMKVNDNKRI